MDLVTASHEYSKLSTSQNDALDKLQRAVRPFDWKQFLSYWRNESGSDSCPTENYSSVQFYLSNVFKFLDVETNPFQQCAIEYLETILDLETRQAFTCKYRNKSITCDESLLGLMAAHDEFDETLTYQISALEFLQKEVERTSLSKWYQFISYWRQWGLPCSGGDPENVIVQGIPCQTSTEVGVCLYDCTKYGGREIQTGLCKEQSKECCLGIPHQRVKYGANHNYCSRYSPLTLTEAKDNNKNSIQLVPVQKQDLKYPSYADVSLDKKDNHMTFQIACVFEVMAAAAKKDDIDLKIVSAFRTYARQEEFYNCNDWMDCKPSCETYNGSSCNIAAKAGKSNHGIGMALDLSFNSAGFDWLRKNALEFGFSNAEGQRLEKPENWHWVFEGKADDDFQSDYYQLPCTAGMPSEVKSGVCMKYSDCNKGVAIPLSKGCENTPGNFFCCIPFPGSRFLPPPSPPTTPTNQVTTLYDKLSAHCVHETSCTGAIFHDPCIYDSSGCVNESNPVFGCQSSDQTCMKDLNWSCPSGEKACIDETEPVWMVDVPGITLSKDIYNQMFQAIRGTPRGEAFYPYLNHALVQVAFNSDNAKQRCYKVAAFVAHHKVETNGMMHFTERTSAANSDYIYGKWQGRGAMHLSGTDKFNNYESQAKMLEIDTILNSPEMVAFPSLGYLTGVIFILRQGSTNDTCINFMGFDDYETFKTLTKCIQGAEMRELEQRWNNFQELVGLLHCDQL
jgi:LAS superfamily LD-carboxypeptidase LdcB